MIAVNSSLARTRPGDEEQERAERVAAGQDVPGTDQPGGDVGDVEDEVALELVGAGGHLSGQLLGHAVEHGHLVRGDDPLDLGLWQPGTEVAGQQLVLQPALDVLGVLARPEPWCQPGTHAVGDRQIDRGAQEEERYEQRYHPDEEPEDADAT